MAKKLGPSVNRWAGMGRVVGNPQINGEWASMQFKTEVPENINGQWQETECMVPLMTNNPKTVNTISQFIQDERQLYVEGFVRSWQNQDGSTTCAVMINTVKLMSQKMYDADAQPNNQQGGGQTQQGGPPSY